MSIPKPAILLLRLLVGGTFIYAGWLKAIDPQTFADHIAGFQLLPAFLINVTALALPVLEILAGGLLILNRFLRSAAFSVLILCGVFVIALGSALVRGLEVDCGCFGGGEASIRGTWISLGRGLLLGLASWILWSHAAKTLRTAFNPPFMREVLPSTNAGFGEKKDF